MHATGIIRRIDELGRVVIPKEIRRTMRVREGDPMEIYTSKDGEIILKKYSPVGEMGDFARHFTESLHKTTGHIACVCDRDRIIAVSGALRRDFLDRKISTQVESVMTNRRTYQAATKKQTPISLTVDDNEGAEYMCQTVAPIIVEGEPVGAVILVNRDSEAEMHEPEMIACQTAACFIGKQLEA